MIFPQLLPRLPEEIKIGVFYLTVAIHDSGDHHIRPGHHATLIAHIKSRER